VTGGVSYVGKPRPAVILQADGFPETLSVTICPLTSNPAEAALFRPVIDPTASNGLELRSRAMADKVMTVPRAKLARRIGQLSSADLALCGRAVSVFLDLVG
jgi:mRNA interferase MazF